MNSPTVSTNLVLVSILVMQLVIIIIELIGDKYLVSNIARQEPTIEN